PRHGEGTCSGRAAACPRRGTARTGAPWQACHLRRCSRRNSPRAPRRPAAAPSTGPPPPPSRAAAPPRARAALDVPTGIPASRSGRSHPWFSPNFPGASGAPRTGVFPATVYSLYSVVELDERTSTSPDSTKLAAVANRSAWAGFRPGSSARSPRRRASRGSGGGSEFIMTTFPVIVTTAVGFVLIRGYEGLSKGAAEVGRADAGRLAQMRGARARRARRAGPEHNDLPARTLRPCCPVGGGPPCLRVRCSCSCRRRADESELRQLLAEPVGAGRRLHLAQENLLRRHLPAVVLLVGPVARRDHRARDRAAGDRPLPGAVAGDARPGRPARRRGAPARASCHADIGSERHVAAARECLHRRVRIEHHHVFRHLRAHLEAEAGAAGGDGRGAAPPAAATFHETATLLDTQPARLRPGDDETEPALSAEEEIRLQHGHD